MMTSNNAASILPQKNRAKGLSTDDSVKRFRIVARDCFVKNGSRQGPAPIERVLASFNGFSPSAG